jgi:hypothetical protein
MIDAEWLKTVQFNTQSGRVTGLVGIGSQFIVFKCEPAEEDPKLGKEIVLKILNTPRLGWYIREIPPDLESTPTYDPSRVNRKLRAQVGNPLFDSMVGSYNDVYERLISVLHKGGVQAIKSMIDDEESETILTFLLKTPGMRRRLEDIALLDASGDPREVVMCNGLLYTRNIEDTREAAAVWARSILQTIDGIPELDGMDPRMLCKNPVWIWGGAVLDGFFNRREMPSAAAYIAEHFGESTARPNFGWMRFEVAAFLWFLRLIEPQDKVQRLIQFCNNAGFGFVLPDPEPWAAEKAHKAPEKLSIRRMPKLSPPWVVPPFPEEGRADPMAQEPELLIAAAATYTQFASELATAAHAVGIAVTLPRTETESDVYFKPWRSVVSVVQDSANSPTASDDECSALYLIQRLLVTAQAISARRDGGAVPDGMARVIEQAGYVALGRAHDVRKNPRFNASYSLGKIAANLHGHGFIHGDLQPQNFTFKQNGEIQSMFDLGRAFSAERPLTALERASDLAVLKKHVTFMEWEAAKLGYRSEARDAEEVLAYFKQK